MAMLTSALTESWHLHEAGTFMSILVTFWRWDAPIDQELLAYACWSHDGHMGAAGSRAEAQRFDL